MNILITGGAGFIGSQLCIKLIDLGHKLTVLDNLSPQIHGNNPKETSSLYKTILGNVNFIEGSVTDMECCKKAVRNQEIIVHYAAETGTGQSMYEVQKYVDVNSNGTAVLLNAIIDQKIAIKKVLVASSRAVYGEGKYYSDKGFVYPEPRKSENMDKGHFEPTHVSANNLYAVPTDEESKLHPSSLYGVTKLNQEQLVSVVCSAHNIPWVSLRYQNVYGPGQSLKNPYTGILSIFSTLIRNGENLNVFEDGLESRDFVYIDDVVTATVLCIESALSNNQIFNIGSGIATSVIAVATALKEKLNKDVEIQISGNYRLGDIRHNYADLSKIKTILNYIPKTSFDSGISKFVEWVKSESIEKNEFSRSIFEMRSNGLLRG